jgi:hypothetical protein
MTNSLDSAELEHDVAPDSQFESYFDTDSGVWSLRRIPTSPPPLASAEPEADQGA